MAPVPRFRLNRIQSQEFHEVGPEPVIVGRTSDADLVVPDATISRRHAEVRATAAGVSVRDLGSSNGTFLNGERIAAGMATEGAVIAFGSAAFRVESSEVRDASEAEPQIVRQRPVGTPSALTDTVEQTTVSVAAPLPGAELTQRRLALLLEVSRSLGRVESVDALLEQIAQCVFRVMDGDRVSILLNEESGLTARVSRDRSGTDAGRAVPRSIARRAVEDRVAVITDDARADDRFGGESIVLQRVCSAMCAPLIGLAGTVEGVLYVDNVHTPHRFSDEDLEFLIAFSGIAAVAIENSRFAERVRREAVARGNFERFFTPALAARIAATADGLRLGGEKRQVSILFSDIRGFTAMSEKMPPDEVAALLSEYFSAMVECVFRHGGTLDKFIGDAILAQWGAPLQAPDDADRALQAALDMQDALDALNRDWAARGRATMQVGIGLNTGEVFAGYVGSERRLEYTILGDAVNLASRLCSAAGAGEILVSGDMLRSVNGARGEVRAGLQLKGLSREVEVFRVVR